MRSLLLISTMVLFGCAGHQSVSKNQCLASDWQTLGYRDGVNGLRSTRLLEHQDACLDHGVTPDRNSYIVGWRQGVREYCRAGNGFAVGERGAGYYNICPDDLAPAFIAAYQDGRELYLVRSAVRNLERSIAKTMERIEQLKAEIVSSAAQQLDPLLTPQARIELVAYTVRLNDEKHRLEHELPRMHQELDASIRKLEYVQASLAAAY